MYYHIAKENNSICPILLKQFMGKYWIEEIIVITKYI